MRIDNPLLEKWDTPFNIPPFRTIKPEHFIPATKKAISIAEKEINSIVESTSSPNYINTIEAMESSGKLLGKIASILFNLNSAETNPGIQKATQEISPLLTRFSNNITLNKDLFRKVKSVYDSVNWSNLTPEESTLLKERYRSFRNGGAELTGKKRERFREVSEELSRLTVKFEENVLKATNSYELHLTSKNDLLGLPTGLIELASEEAAARKKDGWVFTLHYPSFIPFLQYSQKRELRKKLFLAYSSRCFKSDRFNNTDNVRQIVNLRLELANLLGFESFADFILEDRMASSTKVVNSFLDDLFDASRPFAERDLKLISQYANLNGHTGDIERWDWAYYSERLKREKYSIDDEILRPYFELDIVEKAILDLAGTLFGIYFKRIEDIQAYHKDVRTYEVIDKADNHIALLMTDYHPRKGKSGGAWMTSYREQFRSNAGMVRPLVSIVMNFSKPTSSKPALLTHNEVSTLLHEFGHALHGMLSDCKYESISGTNVKRDFVELPSQLMENWAYEKEWLDTWAIHYRTGKTIPEELIQKIKSSLTYNEGYACNRQLSFGFLDMAWHSITEPYEGEISVFEDIAFAKTELLEKVEDTNQSCAFGHLFSGGYAAGYYGYKWAEVLDADAFSLFRKRGIFNSETALSFKENILKKGGSNEPMTLYRNFRKSEPSIDALLKRSGFIDSLSE